LLQLVEEDEEEKKKEKNVYVPSPLDVRWLCSLLLVNPFGGSAAPTKQRAMVLFYFMENSAAAPSIDVPPPVSFSLSHLVIFSFSVISSSIPSLIFPRIQPKYPPYFSRLLRSPLIVNNVQSPPVFPFLLPFFLSPYSLSHFLLLSFFLLTFFLFARRMPVRLGSSATCMDRQLFPPVSLYPAPKHIDTHKHGARITKRKKKTYSETK
jgi:hypothetical protein